MFKAVLFDMDGLLFDTERLYFDQWKKASEKAVLAFSDDLFFRCVGKNTDDTKKLLLDVLGKDFPFEQFYEETSNGAIDEIKSHGPPLKKGAKNILSFLKDKKIPIALATSTDKDMAMWMIEKAGFSEYFDAHAFGSEVQNGKPAPDIFLLAAKKLGVKAAQCIVLEDSSYGLRAAHSAGMKTIFVKDLIDPPQEVLEKVWKRAKDLDVAKEMLG